MKFVIYKIVKENVEQYVAVVAPNTTVASEMVHNQFKDCSIHFKCVCDTVLQLNGQANMVVEQI